MIKANDAIVAARSLIGTPYSELDCINLIKRVIRTAPGGVKDYTTAGTNTLWASYEASGKYRDITWRQEGLAGARAGMLAFKRYGIGDVDHVGIVTGEGTVIHSSSVGGCGVVETTLLAKEGWDLLAIHRYIRPDEDVSVEGEKEMKGYKASVVLNDPNSYLNLRNAPKHGSVIGRLNHGAQVTVQAYTDGWAFVTCEAGRSGYVSMAYLAQETAEEAQEETQICASHIERVAIIDSEGRVFWPVGSFSVQVLAQGESLD